MATAARRLEGKVALITGGASGIGACTARLFAANGAKVVIADIQDEVGHSVAKEIHSTETPSSFIHCDTTDESQIESAVDFTVAQHGKLDVMYNNAGVVDRAKKSILDNTKEDFNRVLGINLTGPFLGTKHAARVMIPNRSGSIITTASIASVLGGITTHAYTTSKHGVVGLTKNLSSELGKFGIRVNCVSPHVVATPLAKEFFQMDDEQISKVYSNMTEKWCQAEDVANAVMWLASDESRFISGLNVVVDGGFTIMNPSFCMFEEN